MAEVSHSDTDGNCEHQAKSDTTEKPPCSHKVSQKVPYYKLFSFADPADYALMVIGVITSVGSGLSLPLMTFLYGELADSFGQNVGTQRVVHEVSKV